MPIAVDPDQEIVTALLRSLPAGSQAVTSVESAYAWLGQHPDEYALVLGPGVPLPQALQLCDHLRTSRPTVSVVLVRGELSTDVFAAAMQAGTRDVVPADDPAAVAGAVGRAHQLHTALRGPGAAAQQGRVITVWSPKGGVGKTTVAVNLGLALAERGARRVCLVDLDLAFGDVAITMQLFPTHSIEHAIGAESTLDAEQLDALLTRHQDALMILAAPTHPDVRDRVTPALVSAVLRTLRETFDYIVVDTSPSFDEQTLTAMDQTDEIVIVATLDVPTLKNVKVALETLDMLDIATDHRRLLLNRADDEVGIHPDRVEGILGMRPDAKVATSIEVAAATNAGVPIVARNPGHPTSAAILGLAALLSGRAGATPVPAPDPEHPVPPAPRGRLWKRR